MNNVPGWATEGLELKADPNQLKGYATNLATVAENLKDDANGPAMAVFGGGEDVSISTGGMAEGQIAQDLDARNAREMMAFLGDQYKELVAHSAATHILADMYETGANNHAISLNSILWAYQEPGATQPKGVPPYLFDKDGKLVTMNALYQESGQASNTSATDKKMGEQRMPNGDLVTTYQTADGGKRSVTKSGDKVTEIVWNSAGVKVYDLVSLPNGSSTTTFYDKDGKAQGSNVRTVTETKSGVCTADKTYEVTHETAKVETKDASGAVTSSTSDHMVTHKDTKAQTQTRDYYTTNGDDPTKTNQRHIPSQPDKANPEDWQRMAEEQSERARQAI
ncbi:hypothetical protein NLX83_40225 [Allokutzneria sp. A3M-2-11 16]|uniref:hypothetical protein n=1 Tax=Allokutzneria sp. A3M-2-11 16 TaxID=2962043 RepID=UPI0020B85018|nr:hypothetical protein [Allokutzneria sp. A3M-2-11 16]MCP3805511.1 hypothetical protein [Allokutzneria sp. A3M-2-11 16]